MKEPLPESESQTARGRGLAVLRGQQGTANIQLERSVTSRRRTSILWRHFEKVPRDSIDFFLLNERFSFHVLEAKAEGKNPLVGKEAGPKIRKSENCRFVILSNGNLTNFWDLERGTHTSSLVSDTGISTGYQNLSQSGRLIEENVTMDYMSHQRPNYALRRPGKTRPKRPRFIDANCLRLSPRLPEESHLALPARHQGRQGPVSFFEMATGTGKT